MFSHVRRLVNATAAALLICACCLSGPAHGADFAVTSPWIGVIAAFIGGSSTKIRVLSTWEQSGRVVAVSRPRAKEKLIALDIKDAERFGVKKGGKNLLVLYETLPMTQEQLYSAFFDPAMLPFIAQNVMRIMADEDKGRYSFYQRRLAEFQSRIESAVDIGRYLLSDTKILDITGAEGAWVRAAVHGAVRAPAEVWDGWKKGDVRSLKAALDEAEKRKWLILLDPWTPPEIRAVATAYKNRLTLPPPTGNQDYFIFLHDVFLIIWNKTK